MVGTGALAPIATVGTVEEQPPLVPVGLDPAGAPGAGNDGDATSNATDERGNVDAPEAELLDSEAEDEFDETGSAGTGPNATREGGNIAELLENDHDSEEVSDTDSEDESEGGVTFIAGQRVWDIKERSLATATRVQTVANGWG